MESATSQGLLSCLGDFTWVNSRGASSLDWGEDSRFFVEKCNYYQELGEVRDGDCFFVNSLLIVNDDAETEF